MLIPAPTSPSAVADSHTWMLVKPCRASERAQPIPPIPAPMLRRRQTCPGSVVQPVGYSTTHMWMFRSASGGAMVSELSLVLGEGEEILSFENRREDEKARCRGRSPCNTGFDLFDQDIFVTDKSVARGSYRAVYGPDHPPRPSLGPSPLGDSRQCGDLVVSI